MFAEAKTVSSSSVIVGVEKEPIGAPIAAENNLAELVLPVTPARIFKVVTGSK